jgi:hypothetical protein
MRLLRRSSSNFRARRVGQTWQSATRDRKNEDSNYHHHAARNDDVEERMVTVRSRVHEFSSRVLIFDVDIFDACIKNGR